ncbi:MAG: DsbA family protein [Sulfitobacter sp.]
MYKSLLAATAMALALPAAAADLKELSDVERAQFRAEVRSYLLENPEVIMEAVEVLRLREAQGQQEAEVSMVSDNAEEIFNDGYSWVGGNPEGDITLVEFLDYRCGYCKRAHGEVAKLLESDGNIRLIVKEFPILGEDSVLASRFAIATRQIAGNDEYKALHDALMALQGNVTQPVLERLSDGLGFDTAAIVARMDSDEVSAEIAQNHALAQKLAITGTPTFVMQDEMLRGYLPFDQMQALVDEKRG